MRGTTRPHSHSHSHSRVGGSSYSTASFSHVAAAAAVPVAAASTSLPLPHSPVPLNWRVSFSPRERSAECASITSSVEQLQKRCQCALQQLRVRRSVTLSMMDEDEFVHGQLLQRAADLADGVGNQHPPEKFFSHTPPIVSLLPLRTLLADLQQVRSSESAVT